MNYYVPQSHHPRPISPHFIKLTHNSVHFPNTPSMNNHSSTKHINNYFINHSPNFKSKHLNKHTTSNDSNSSSSSSANISFSLYNKIFSPHESNNSSTNPLIPKTPRKHNYSSEQICHQKPLDEQYTQTKNIKFNPKNKTLVLDLDETLVHSSFKPFHNNPDIQLKIKYKNTYHNVYVLKRPYVDKFLYFMSKYYNIFIFTASIPEYAEPLLDKLDKYNVIQKKYYRNDCTYNKGLFIKDLTKIGIDLKDVLLVDNNPVSYKLNIENGVPIKSWYDDKEDIELNKMIPFLECLSEVDDVRTFIREVVYKDEVNYGKVVQMINKRNRKQIEENVNECVYMERSKSVKHCKLINNIISKKIKNKNVDIKNEKENNGYNIRKYNVINTTRCNQLKKEIINDINTSNPQINELIINSKTNISNINDCNNENQEINNSNYYNSDYNNKKERNIFTSHDYANNISLSSRHLFLKKEINSYHQKQINPMNTPISNKYMRNNIQYSANIQQPRHKSFLRDIPVQHVTPYFVDNNYSGCNNNYYKQKEIKNNNENFKQNTSISAFSKETNYYLKRKMVCRQNSKNQLNKKTMINKKAYFNRISFNDLNTQTQRIKANIN